MNLDMSRADFIKNYFEKQFFIRKQAVPDHGVKWKHVNEALFSWNPREGLIHLHHDGLVPLEKYTESFMDVGLNRLKIVKDVFNEYLRNGATLVLNRIDTKMLRIQQMTMMISHFVGEKAVANGYAAFGGKGTFGKHWDTHDVFAVQLIGRKRWKVFEPTMPLPLPHQKSKEYKHECPETPLFDDVLEAGDILYIPRGWWHEAVPLENEETFHIAVGIHTAHVADYVAWSCSNTLAQVLDFRRTLKFEDDGQQSIQDALASIHRILLDPDNLRAFKNAQVSQERVVSPFAIERFGHDKSAELDPGQTVMLNSAYKTVAGSDHFSVNGFSINADSVSARFMRELSTEETLGRNGRARHEGDLKTKALIGALLNKDVLGFYE